MENILTDEPVLAQSTRSHADIFAELKAKTLEAKKYKNIPVARAAFAQNDDVDEDILDQDTVQQSQRYTTIRLKSFF
jgi:hypothetical protein